MKVITILIMGLMVFLTGCEEKETIRYIGIVEKVVVIDNGYVTKDDLISPLYEVYIIPLAGVFIKDNKIYKTNPCFKGQKVYSFDKTFISRKKCYDKHPTEASD